MLSSLLYYNLYISYLPLSPTLSFAVKASQNSFFPPLFWNKFYLCEIGGYVQLIFRDMGIDQSFFLPIIINKIRFRQIYGGKSGMHLYPPKQIKPSKFLEIYQIFNQNHIRIILESNLNYPIFKKKLGRPWETDTFLVPCSIPSWIVLQFCF